MTASLHLEKRGADGLLPPALPACSYPGWSPLVLLFQHPSFLKLHLYPGMDAISILPRHLPGLHGLPISLSHSRDLPSFIHTVSAQ